MVAGQAALARHASRGSPGPVARLRNRCQTLVVAGIRRQAIARGRRGPATGNGVSPIIAYAAADLIPPDWWWYELNPMVGLIAGFRWALFGADAPTLRMLGLSVAVTLAVFLSGLWYFRRVEDWIADRI